MTGLKRVYFNEFNVLMGDAAYLPLVSGLLHAHALTSEKVRATYEFAPYLFHIDSPANILAHYDKPPAVAAFSLLMWNEQLNLHIAAEIKRRHPDCVIVFGGAQVPHHPEEFFATYPFVDVAVRGEGEEAFTEILERLADGADLDNLAGVSWRAPDGTIHAAENEREFQRDLDVYPSPYLEGLYDELMASRPDVTFQAIVETNRGCPFHCTFCYWGKGGLSRKYRYHGLDRVSAEIVWMGENKIRYVFNADSNFGMNKRDREIADLLVETKRKYGFPEKFRTCYGKNTDDKIFEIGNLFHEHQLEKGITISYQSTDPTVQKNIKRDNIKLSVARELHQRFNKLDVPVYTELIIGLPGETEETWRKGIDEILSSGLKNQLFMYFCQVYPNTDLADPEYVREHGLVTQRVELNEIHGSVRHSDWVAEYEDLVVTSSTMPLDSWKRMAMLSWMTMLMHSLKLGFFVMCWMHEKLGVRHSDYFQRLISVSPEDEAPMLSAQLALFQDKLGRIGRGEGRGCILPDCGVIYWDVEEAAFLDLSRDFGAFYDELERLTRGYLKDRGIAYDSEELAEVFHYQRLRLPTPAGSLAGRHGFAHSVPSYFETFFDDHRVDLARRPEVLVVEPRDFGGDRERFARETILWGRKSGTMLAKARVAELEAQLAG
ncbi:hypothetical protein A6A04_10605 [Paramagnetospirillum marisnigri]|uniref:Uncharacterized protein n=1 Tax=Paramagnetospirillum marisnigri TaxID=1285242 RepID=A0A178MZL6_9PROT|nr:radical SAM protein [Paramagnetospirillum marisnigri]OAN56001.1 hypothetical protein A6A04_10605 [Paramagnetospirillum marisnigri]